MTKWNLQPFIIIWMVPGEQGKKLFTMAPGCVKTANWMKLKKKDQLGYQEKCSNEDLLVCANGKSPVTWGILKLAWTKS